MTSKRDTRTGPDDRAYSLAFSAEADKALGRIQPKVARRIIEGMRAIAADPFGRHPNAKSLSGSDEFRLRVGDWRVLYRVEPRVRRVYVGDVLKREDAYR